MEYRHEWKYIVSEQQLALLYARLSVLMRRDRHQARPDGYLIRTVYFDDLDDSFLKQNMTGADNRVKFRLRSYEASDAVIQLETKEKIRGMTRKSSCTVSRTQCETLLSGRAGAFDAGAPQPAQRLWLAMRQGVLRPRVIVEYRRQAFTEPVGNVRVTFDRNIAGCDRIDQFFSAAIDRYPVLPPGRHILEVKYDELLPNHLAQAMDLGDLTRTTFSKYVMSRMQ